MDCLCNSYISFCISFHSCKSIFGTGLGGSLNLKITSCKKFFAPRIICRNISGSQPYVLIDCNVSSVIFSCLIFKISSSGTPSTNATSTVRFHSCLAALSAFISSAFGLFFPIFFVARYTPPCWNTDSFSDSSFTYRLIVSVNNSLTSLVNALFLNHSSFFVKI